MRKHLLAAVVLVCLMTTSLEAQVGSTPGETDFIITESSQIVKRGWARHGTAPTIWELVRKFEPATMRG